MHGYLSEQEFLEDLAVFLGGYFFALALLNAIAAFCPWGTAVRANADGAWAGAARWPRLWLLPAIGFSILGTLSIAGQAAWLALPARLRDGLDALTGPVVVCASTLAVLLVLFRWRRFFVKPAVAWTLLNAALLFMGLSLTDSDFAKIITKPDNVAIVSMIFLLGYFTWLAAYKAQQNDERVVRGEEPLESLDREKVLVWPDLVYIELLCMIVLSAVLIFWAIGLKAPLEEPASAVKTPNPSKAPWYFVGLQEMLYYYDAWLAGVVLPALIILGLMAIPYLDRNPRGNGYYTIRERKFAYLTFQFGFLLLWIMLILIGTFLRGPNWDFFGVYETWDVHKPPQPSNVNLSYLVWVRALGVGLPQPPENCGGLLRLAWLLWRESPGILLLGVYLLLLPPALARFSKFFRGLSAQMGLWRYGMMLVLLLIMILLPVKMIARWTGGVQYFIALPEYQLNF